MDKQNNNPENETFEEALSALIDKGIVEAKGVDEDGELTYGLTELGEEYARRMNSGA